MKCLSGSCSHVVYKPESWWFNPQFHLTNVECSRRARWRLVWLIPPSVYELSVWMGECEAKCKALWWSLGLWKHYVNAVHLKGRGKKHLETWESLSKMRLPLYPWSKHTWIMHLSSFSFIQAFAYWLKLCSNFRELLKVERCFN